MSEQLSPLARRDSNPSAMDVTRPNRQPAAGQRSDSRHTPQEKQPDPITLTISGVLLFVVVMVVVIARTLYPGG